MKALPSYDDLNFFITVDGESIDNSNITETCSDGYVFKILNSLQSSQPKLIGKLKPWNFYSCIYSCGKHHIKYEPPHEKTNTAYAKTKAQISFAVTAKLISAFVFATWIVRFLYFLNPKFPAFSYLLCRLVQLGLCRTCSETTLLVFPRGGSILI